MNPIPGLKVKVVGRENAGFAEIHSCTDTHGLIQIRYYRSPVDFKTEHVHPRELQYKRLPAQTRVFCGLDGRIAYGRALVCRKEETNPRTYMVKFSGRISLFEISEDVFHVQAELGSADPVRVVSELAHDSPFFFEQRISLLRQILRQSEFCQGLTALLSSKIQILDHQVEVANRILKDPTIRYLLADEVGLGKTIEAGIVLRQIYLDYPEAMIGVFVPDALIQQWEDELSNKFGLDEVFIHGHSELNTAEMSGRDWDIVLIDEAHRLVPTATSSKGMHQTYKNAKRLSQKSRHLLLLSATPTLHRTEELLALLELLDPENYKRSDLSHFQKLCGHRQEIGRSFLALTSSQLPTLIKRRAKKISELLSEDPVVRSLTEQIQNPNANINELSHSLQLHLSETYRIYRRMLRTRRQWLVENSDSFSRKIDLIIEYGISEDLYTELWRLLEEWRIEVAGSKSYSSLEGIAELYIDLAQAISSDWERLLGLIDLLSSGKKHHESALRILHKMQDLVNNDKSCSERIDLLQQILKQRLRRDLPGSKYVVFISNPKAVKRIEKFLQENLTSSIFSVHSLMPRAECSAVISNFRLEIGNCVLLTDAVGEEGFNLQYSKALILYDLPWSPMRVEQRIGRLDRIDRQGRIPCHVICTIEDDTLALDEAWHRVLEKGFGIFKDSISDLQSIIEEQMSNLKQQAFLGGPSVLLDSISKLDDTIREERERISEQDVIDGLHSLKTGEHSLSSAVRIADSEDLIFHSTLQRYLELNLGLEQRTDSRTKNFCFRRRKFSDPIITAEKLIPVVSLMGATSTTSRDKATKDPLLEFFRPGHPGVDACRDLLRWDERGRAFVLWRPCAGIGNLRIIFRIYVYVSADLTPIIERLKKTNWDPVRQGGLLRLLRGWFPDIIQEVVLDEEGEEADKHLSQICHLPYQKGRDLNLGNDRAKYLRQAVGDETWKSICKLTSKKAISLVQNSRRIQNKLITANALAKEYFSVTQARLLARKHAQIDSDRNIRKTLVSESDLSDLVQLVLRNPTMMLDTVGVYALSDRPFWQGG